VDAPFTSEDEDMQHNFWAGITFSREYKNIV
jgi:hypothetical protein